MTGAQVPDAAELGLRRSADRLLRRIARRGTWWLGLLGGASLAGAAAQLLLPAAVGRALDAMLRPPSHGAGPAAVAPHAAAAAPHAAAAAPHAATAHISATGWLACCAVLVATVVLAGACVQLATGTVSAGATAWLRRLLARQVLSCGPGLLGRFSPGDAVSRIVGGSAEAGAAPASVVLAVTAVVPPAGSIVALGLIDPWLMAAFAAGFPALAWVLRAFVRDSSDVSAGYQHAQGAIAGRLIDALAGARTIAAAGTRGREQARILEPLRRLRGQGDTSWRIQARAAAQSTLIVPVLQVIVLAVAGIELARHRMTPGELVAASQYAVLAVGVGASIGQLGQLARARGGARRAAELLAEPAPGYGTQRPAPGRGQLRFRCVTARRGGTEVLRELDLTVPGGAAVAVVGGSGAGKSTLASLAGRLADPDEGTVTLDGTDLRRLSRPALRQAVVYAFERPALFGATPFEAIGFGAWRPAPGQVLAAAEDSRAAPFLARLPRGMDTPLDEAPMSGGELQRLGLARAFAHAGRARLLILDDATSSLDTATEMLVSRVLTEQMSGCTRLIVAHRAATAARADLVAWLDGGRLRALAPHRELQSDPAYRAVFGADGAAREAPC